MSAATNFAAVLAVATGLACAPVLADEPRTARGENLVVFIGQKISLVAQAPRPCANCMIMYSHYLATYRVVEQVHGKALGESLTFDVYDHYGEPAFSRYETVLLFVSRLRDGSWQHERYLFNDLYKATDGQWYGCGDPYRSFRDPPRTVRAQPVRFPAPVSYPVDKIDPEDLEVYYPPGYFDIRDGRAYCLMGTSVNDLFTAKKETVLKARGIFE